jgi:hypothetical protein
MVEIGNEFELNEQYKIRIMSSEEFAPYEKKYTPVVFEDDHSIFPFHYLTDEEKSKIKCLKEGMYKNPFVLWLGVFTKENEFVGWSYGYQENAMVYYMCNSAILEGHRRKGLYTALMKTSISILEEQGFQVIYSRHNATNNSVIIPKLKAGFIISSLEMDDVFGVMVHLKYFTNTTRRKIMDYRAGQLKPDEELQKLFDL